MIPSRSQLSGPQRNTQDQVMQYHISLLETRPEIVRTCPKIRRSEGDIAFWQHGRSEKKFLKI
jgi:hypothetical protein